jgi:hypothetical protein
LIVSLEASENEGPTGTVGPSCKWRRGLD